MAEKMTLTDAEIKWLLTSPEALRAVADYNDLQESQADSMGMPCSIHRERRIAFHAEVKRIEDEWNAEREPEQRVFLPDAHLTQPAQAVDVGYDDALNDAGWAFIEAMPERLPGPIFNNVKFALKVAIEKWLSARALGNAQAEGWRPIETAPKDGRELILLLTPSRFPQVAYSNSWWRCGFSVECKPTHWAPIPSLPTPPQPEE